MKKLHFTLCLLLICFGSLITEADGNHLYEVNRGERPPINYRELPAEALEEGVFLVKFTGRHTAHLDQDPLVVNHKGVVEFQLEEVDRLNNHFGVFEATPYFLSPALDNEFSERHRAWGFHLWYLLRVNTKTDIREAVIQYGSLKDIEIAEPILKKESVFGSDRQYLTDENETDNKQSNDWFPNDPQFVNQWHYHNTGQQGGTLGSDISLPAAWEIEKGNNNVVVAIIDSGIDQNHPDLSGNMWSGIGYNFVNNTSNIEPGNHGTHVAGTVAAVSNNNTGVAGIAGGSGTGDGVRLMSCQVFTSSSQGGFHLAPIYAADNNASISQNSWSYTSPGYYEQSVLDAIDYFNVNGGGDAMSGGITIFAAGNSNSSSAYYPAYYSGTMAVAATNNQDAKAWYSNFGTWIDISAPGGETNNVAQRGVLSTITGNSYNYYQGTSMACPHVSGVAALMLSLAYGTLSPDEVEDILISTTDNHYGANPSYQGLLGSGRLNAYQALLLTQAYQILPPNPENFEAFAISDTEIALGWLLNDQGHDVLLAWSADGEFGIPEEGNTYPLGSTIPGGGTVIYSGNDQDFVHSGLNASTIYYYRIWSLSGEGVYSWGTGTDATTACGILTMPVFEGFSDDGFLECWTFDPSQGNWQFTTDYGNPAPAVRFTWNPTVTNYSFALESPPINGMVNASSITLEYDLFLNNFSSNTLEKMSVEVFSQGAWAEIMEFNNSGGGISWATHSMDITSLVSNQVFNVRFRAHGANSYNINWWVIDNFKIEYTAAPFIIVSEGGEGGEIVPEGNIEVNPGENQIFDITADPGFLIELLLVDGNPVPEAHGQVTYSYTFSQVESDHTIQVSFAQQLQELLLSFGQGYNWFSINLDPGGFSVNNVLQDLEPCEGDQLIAQGAFASYNESLDLWLGSLTTLDPMQMYKLFLCSDQNMILQGQPLEVLPLEVNAGFSWMGYPLQECMDINQALENISPLPQNNDRILNQSGFSAYNADLGLWVGSITQLCPGEGYILNFSNSATIVFPENKNLCAEPLFQTFSSPAGIYPESFKQYGMMLLAQLELPEGIFSLNPKDVVYAFAGDECRGMAAPMLDHDGKIFLTIGSDQKEGESIHFRLWSQDEQQLLDLEKTMTFSALKQAGTLDEPYILNVSDQTALNIWDPGGNIFVGTPSPNPFSEVTIIPFELSREAQVRLSLYHTHGQVVEVITDRFFDAGMHEVAIRKGSHNTGIYFYRFEVRGDHRPFVKSGKLILR